MGLADYVKLHQEGTGEGHEGHGKGYQPRAPDGMGTFGDRHIEAGNLLAQGGGGVWPMERGIQGFRGSPRCGVLLGRDRVDTAVALPSEGSAPKQNPNPNQNPNPYRWLWWTIDSILLSRWPVLARGALSLPFEMEKVG